ncbi:M15 family metallopeptidase [Paenibacillus sp. MSJ-34]|uniref:M15 family metallopeptidase n=1 Tax=Paenibacillus sp. MSJ-34 TaxID=2841529 RepID=UPI001C1146CD|nr:M15 family metallopeptidase [Paenibacillus sp. MSJ-34]MBU5444481.1 M15 family metallopeptidase [Paenibacillus sp. MSJ-34]
MKKWFYAMIILLLLGWGIHTFQQSEELDEVLPPEESELRLPELSHNTLTINRSEIYKGDLLLINTQYPVPNHAEIQDVVNLFEQNHLVDGFGISDNSVELPLDMLKRFTAMIESARAEGVNHFLINSGYRDLEKQAELYEQLGSKQANPPGYSEHNLGLSMDIGSSLGLMKDAPEGKWLENNAWKHGFILRYPEDKTNITGVMYEPWHFRYVGLPHSAIMQEHDFVLEEYLEYLREQGTVYAEVEGKEYKVSYYPIQAERSIKVPIEGSYTVSGNNTDGVIVTTWGGDPVSVGMEDR